MVDGDPVGARTGAADGVRVGFRVGSDVLGGCDGATESEGTLVGRCEEVGCWVGRNDGGVEGTEEEEGTELGEEMGDAVEMGTRVGTFVGGGTVGRLERVGALVIGTNTSGASVVGGDEGDLVGMRVAGVDVVAGAALGAVVGLLLGIALGVARTDMTGADVCS